MARAFKRPWRKTLTNLFHAVNAGDQKDVDSLINALDVKKLNTAKSIFDGNWYILTFAVYKGDKQTARKLLARGVNVNSISYRIERAPQPVGYGMYSTAGDRTYLTPLTAAMDRRDIVLVKLLTEAGVAVNKPIIGDHIYEEEGGYAQYTAHQSALYKAIYLDNHWLVLALLQAGADPNLKDDAGRSPLDDACDRPIIEPNIIKHIVRYGGQTTYKKGDFIHNSVGYILSELCSALSFDEGSRKTTDQLTVVRFILQATYNHANSPASVAVREVVERMKPELEVEDEEISSQFSSWARFVLRYVNTPSPLCQIARTAVRTALGRCCCPESVAKLPIPVTLQSYLNLDR